MRKSLLCTLAVLVLASNAWAVMYTGSIGGEGGSGLYGTDGWSDARLSWVVKSPDENQGYWWSYVYTFSVDEKDISHIILEVSPGLNLAKDI